MREVPNCLELALGLEDKNRHDSNKEVGSDMILGNIDSSSF